MEHRFRLSFGYNDTHLSVHEQHIGWATKEFGEKIKIGSKRGSNQMRSRACKSSNYYLEYDCNIFAQMGL